MKTTRGEHQNPGASGRLRFLLRLQIGIPTLEDGPQFTIEGLGLNGVWSIAISGCGIVHGDMQLIGLNVL
jgi:hypothetical protein